MDENLKEGLEVSKLAVNHDAQGRAREAAFMYFMAVQLLEKAALAEADGGRKAVIQKKASEYHSRAVELSQQLKQEDEPQQEDSQRQRRQQSLLDGPAPAPVSLDSLEWSNLVTPSNAQAPPSSATGAEARGSADVAIDVDLGIERTPGGPTVDEKMEMMQQALHLIEQAALAAEQGGPRVTDALQGYSLGLQRLEELYDLETAPKMKKELENRMRQLKLRIVHTKVHNVAQSKVCDAATPYYRQANAAYESARALDDVSRFDEAVKAYKLCNTHFKQAMEAEFSPYGKKIIAKRMLLCNQRIEQIEQWTRGGETVLPVKMGLKKNEIYEPPQQDEPAGLLDKWKSAFSGLLGGNSKVDSGVGVVGTLMTENPDCEGEWLTSITVKDTKTMTNPSRTKTYTVYVLEVASKTMKDGDLIDSSRWEVVRRFSQFKLLNAKISSTLELPAMPELPPDHLLDNVLLPHIVFERKTGLQSYFNILLNMPPHAHLNRVLLRFLSNSFMS